VIYGDKRSFVYLTYDIARRYNSAPISIDCTLSGVISRHVVTNGAIIFNHRVVCCPCRCLHSRVYGNFWRSTI